MASVILFVIETSDIAQSFFNLNIMQFLGRVSFPLYLYHEYMLELTFVKSFNYGAWLVSDGHRVLMVLMTTILLLGVSEVLTIWVDRPSIEVTSWVGRGLFGEWNFSETVFQSIPSWPQAVRKYVGDKCKETLESALYINPLNWFKEICQLGKKVRGYMRIGMDCDEERGVSPALDRLLSNEDK
jgi:hypothetical protein